jgi:hypothetical protein
MNQFFKDIMTTKDGQSYDVVRVAIVGVLLFLPWILLWGISMYTYGYFFNKPFDISAAFNGVGIFLMMFGAFLLQGAGSLLMKKSTEPNEEKDDVDSK